MVSEEVAKDNVENHYKLDGANNSKICFNIKSRS